MYINLDDYKIIYPDVRSLPKELQDMRYDAYEKYRNDSIEQVKEERNKIIQENNQTPSHSLKNSQSARNFITIEYMKEKLIEEEKKIQKELNKEEKKKFNI